MAAVDTKTAIINAADEILSDSALMNLLIERRISWDTISVFDIQPCGNGWKYPIPGGGFHWKNANNKAADKYRWMDKKPDTASFYYVDDLGDQIAKAGGCAWYVSGQADVWAMHSAEIYNVFSAFGESYIPENFLDFLKLNGVEYLYIAPDLDDTGKRWAGIIAAALQDNQFIELDCRKLPDELGKGSDLGKAWRGYKPGNPDAPFLRYLLGLQRYTPEIPEPPKIKRSSIPENYRATPEGYRTLIADTLGVTGWKSNGASIKNVHCPFHDDKHPSATLHQEIGLYCHTEGKWYSWNKVGVKIGVGALIGWQLERNPSLMSCEVREALIRSGFTSLARLLDVLNLKGWEPGRAFTRAEANKACEGILSDWTIRDALGNKCGFCPIILLINVNGTKTTLIHKTRRPPKFYRLPSPSEIEKMLAEKFDIRIAYHHYQVIEIEKVKSAADYRAESYASLPRRKPGRYARKTLTSRIGVSNKTGIRYDKRAILTVIPNIVKTEITAAELIELPDNLTAKQHFGFWLENEIGERFPAIKKSIDAIMRQGGGKVYRVEQLANFYSGSREANNAD